MSACWSIYNLSLWWQVWLDCIGENPADNEAIGDIQYYPATSGFSSEYFPYLNQARKKTVQRRHLQQWNFLDSQNFWRFGFLLYYEDFAARIRIILQYSDPTRFRIRIRVSKMFFPHLHLCSLDILNICIVLLKREENFNGYSLSKVHRVE